jgi:DNA-binding NarL/FixJ family response regulator
MAMRAGVTRTTESAANPADPIALVISAGSGELRRRIATALSGQEMLVAAQVEDADEIAALEVGVGAIAILACDVDEAREMAALRRLRRGARELAVVVISPPATGTGVRRALDAGADALVFDPELELTLAPTVRAVAIGQSVVPREFRASVERPILSHRENQVLALVRRGLTNAEIAERLFLAESTIKSHLSSIFTKFGVRSRKEVAAAFIDAEQALEAAIALAESSDPPG